MAKGGIMAYELNGRGYTAVGDYLLPKSRMNVMKPCI